MTAAFFYDMGECFRYLLGLVLPRSGVGVRRRCLARTDVALPCYGDSDIYLLFGVHA